jgi:hypothetical protein
VASAGSKYEPFAYVPLGRSAGGGAAGAAPTASRFASVMASTSKAVRANVKRGIVAEAEGGLAGKKRGRG